MGCDIHCYIEYQDGPDGDRWQSFGGCINPGRNYGVFGTLAGVRGGSALVPPRGMPSDAGWSAREDNRRYISDTPTDREVTPEHAKYYVEKCGAEYGAPRKDDMPAWVTDPDWHTHSWLTPGKWASALIAAEGMWTVGPQYYAILSALRELEHRTGKARIVFWFDN